MNCIEEIYSVRRLRLVEEIEDAVNKHFSQLQSELHRALELPVKIPEGTKIPESSSEGQVLVPHHSGGDTPNTQKTISAGLPFPPHNYQISEDQSGRVVFGK